MFSLRLKNYRCFEDTKDIELRPINILVGNNSSGKSSFLKIFPLIKQSIGVKRNGTFLWFGPEVDFKNFSNIVKNQGEPLVLSFILTNFTALQRRLLFNRKGVDLKVTLFLSSMKDGEKDFDYLSKLEISFEDQQIELQYNLKRNTCKVLINGNPTPENFDILLTSETNSLLPRFLFVHENEVDQESPFWSINYFRNLSSSFPLFNKISRRLKLGSKDDIIKYILKNINNGDEETHLDVNRQTLNEAYLLLHLNNIIDAINLEFLKLSDHITYIGPFRSTAQRYYRIQNFAVDSIDSNGQNFAMYLYNLSPEKLEKFQQWTYNFFNFIVDVKSSSGNVEMVIRESTNQEHNMVDVGFGYTQILPILGVIWKSLYQIDHYSISSISHEHNERIIAIEQPELHLHPRLQGLFVRMLVKVIQKAQANGLDIKFVIETHSDTIISVIGEMIALSKCKKEDINVYVFNALNEGLDSYVVKSSFTNDGQLENWPYGFFSDYGFPD